MEIKTSEIQCFNCESNNYDTICSVSDFCYSTCRNTFNYVQCNGCENIYLVNRPNLEYLDTIYPQDYPTYDYEKSLGKLINNFRNKFQEKKIKIIDSLLKDKDTIIDVGSGGGDFLKIFKKISKKNLEYYGLDFSNHACEMLKKNHLKVIKKRFEDLDENEFSNVGAVTMFQMIEHIDNPKKNIQKAFKILKENGVLVIETPDINSWDYKIFKKRYWSGWHAPRHWNILKNNFLIKLLEENGFVIIKNNHTANPYAWLHSLQYMLKYKYNMKKLSKYFDVNNFVLVVFFTILDFVQIFFSNKTSNSQIIAMKKTI